MATFKCKMCGATLNVTDNQTVVTCDYCGLKQTVANADDERKAGLFNRANSLRQANDFDKALISYQSIISLFPDEPEAHWGACLCRYGIEYVEDPATKQKKPTMHRASFESILKDPDYLFALAHADVVAREEYQAEALEISNIQKSILAISQKEQPFDIFICYKETDETGRRTPDSVIAQDIYDGLTEKGYKVFFARITLESKLGTMYEPYIFAALNSAKIMLVIGSRPDFFNAVWVKNEWSRFLALMQSRPGHYLIPCYKDMDAYKMPEEFLSFQAQDLGKLGYQQDLFHGIDKLLGRESFTSQPQTRIIQTDVNIEALLKRATILIGDRNYSKADELLERVLNNDPENSEAYVLKLLIELQLTSFDELKRLPNTLESNSNFRKAYDFGDSKQKTKLNAVNEAITARNEEARLDRLYNIALQYKNSKQYAEAEKAFSELAGYRDATKQAAECVTLGKEDIYRRASVLKENKQYDEAVEVFQKVIDYKDSEKQIAECKESKNSDTYKKAIELKNAKQFDQAKEIFMTILTYQDSDFQIDECDRLKTEEKKEAIYKVCVFDHAIDPAKDKRDLENACANLAKIPGYKDADQLLVLYENTLNEYEKKLAAEKEMRDRERAKKRRKAKKITFIAGMSALGITGVLLLTFLFLVPNARQGEIQAAIDGGDYEKVAALIEKNSWYGDASNLRQMAKAGSAFKNLDYESGIDYIYNIGGSVGVSYDSNGGSANKSSEVIKKKAAYINNEADKAGHDFHGWILDSYTLKSAEHHAEISLKASYETITYSVTVDLNGGNAENVPASYNTEESKALPNPTKKGYTFLGWTGSNLDSPTKDYVIPEGSVGNKTFKANWKANEYVIHLDSAGGSVTTDSVAVTFDSQYTLPNPEYRGHNFIGWYMADGSKLDSTGTYVFDTDLYLTARWDAIDYEIIYNLDGGTNSSDNPGNYTAEDSTIVLSDPTKVGYTFLGWTTGSVTEPTKGLSIESGSVGDLAFTANWQANTYKVHIDLNGGTAQKTDYDIVYDSDYSLTDIFRTGYSLTGYKNGDDVVEKSGRWTIASDCTLKAIWEADPDTPYTVNYYVEKLDGTGYELKESETQKGASDSTITVTAKNITGFTPKKMSEDISIAPDGSTILDFYYTRNSYTLSFVSNGGNTVNSVTLKYEETLPSSIFTSRSGYTFEGWYTDATQKEKFDKMPAEDTTAFAYYSEETKAYFFDSVESSSGVTIAKAKDVSGKVVIPHYIGGKEVVAVGDAAFKDAISVTSVVLPDSVETLGASAFAGCSSLEKVEGTSNLTEIRESAFEGCRSLTVCPDFSSVAKIGDNAFKDCVSLTGITVSESLTEIGNRSFSGCISLLQTPDLTNVISIGDYAFDGCTMLSEIKGLTVSDSLGEFVFNACENISKLALSFRDEVEKFYVAKMVGSSDYSRTSENFYAVSTLDGQTYYVPKSLAEIELNSNDVPEDFAFGLSSLAKFSGKEAMTKIGDYGFYGCSSLHSFNGNGFNLSESVSSIGKYAFADSGANFATLVLPTDISSIGSYAFKNWPLISEVVVPDGIASFGNGVFAGATSLRKLTAPKIFDLKGEGASYSINNEIGTYHWTLSDGVYTSTNSGIANSDSKMQITFNVAGSLNLSYMVRTGYYTGWFGYRRYYGVLNIIKNGSLVVNDSDMWSFSDKEIVVAKGDVLEIVYHKDNNESDAYGDLAKIKFNSFKSILETNPIGHLNNFFGNSLENDNADVPSSLKEVYLTQAEEIRDDAFANCSRIEIIGLDGTESVGKNVFLNCSSLRSLTVPDTVDSIGANSLSGCSSLETLELPFVGTSQSSNEDLGVLFGTESYNNSYSAVQASGTFYFPNSLNMLTIGKGLIGASSCAGLTSITSLTVGDGVESIGEGAFQGCNSVEKITLPFVGGTADAQYGFKAAFGYIFGMYEGNTNTTTNINYKTSTDYYTASGMASSTNASAYRYLIPSSIRNVEITSADRLPAGAFRNCDLIEKIAINANASSIGNYAFSNCTSLARFNSSEDGVFNIPANVNSIVDYCFQNCFEISTVNASDDITYIGKYAFYGCSAMSKFNSDEAGKLNIPASCETIGDYAFQNCVLMTEIVVPDSVTEIGEGAFQGCNSVEKITLPFVGGTADAQYGCKAAFGYIFGMYDNNSTSDSYKTSLNVYTTSGYVSASDQKGYKYLIPKSLLHVYVTCDLQISAGAFRNCDLIEDINFATSCDTSSHNVFENCNAEVAKELIINKIVPWDGQTVASSFSSGVGTVDEPFIIDNGSQLALLAKNVELGNSYGGFYFKLGTDINLNGYSIQIGDYNHPFQGVLDGFGHKIKNLVITSSNDYVGFIPNLTGSLLNISFINLKIVGSGSSNKTYVSLVAHLSNSGTVENCNVYGEINNSGSIYVYVGGIAGFSNGTIVGCYSNCKVSAISTSHAYAGGIAGYVDSGTVSMCYVAGQISAKGSSIANSRNGDVCGYLNSSANVSDCYYSDAIIFIRNGVENSYYLLLGDILSKTDYWGLANAK